MAPGEFYAVARGRREGIYRTWPEADAQVTGFSGAIHKNFATEHEARAYLIEKGSTAAEAQLPPAAPLQAQASDHEDISDSMKELEEKTGSLSLSPTQREVQLLPDPGFVVFCSASALDNGSDDGHGAFACVFPNREGWNIVRSLDGASKSNRAVYCAALGAIQRVNEHDPKQDHALAICSNSQLLIDTMTKWISRWRTNGWRTKDGKSVKNEDVLKDILREQGVRHIKWVYTKADTNSQAWESMWINHARRNAQALAEAARSASTCVYE